MSRTKLGILVLTVALSSLTISAVPQKPIRAEKEVFKDVNNWAATAPGAIKLKGFKPFRAVYKRSYSQASGPNAGQARTDLIIMYAEEVGWDGKAAIMINLIDSADPKWEDTNARQFFTVIDRQDMHVYFESGPIPGKAKDYYFAQPSNGIATMVTTAEGTVQTQKFPAGAVGWGPGPWAMASMDLKGGMKIHLSPAITPVGSILGHRQGIVKDRREFKDAGGRKHNAWLIETGGNLSSSRMGQLYLIPEPPYFLASFSRDLDTGQETDGTRLLSFRYLD